MKFLKPEEYQNKANEIFHTVREQIKDILPRARVEHVGSSAVPGCISKGDLDIFVGVDALEFQEVLKKLMKIGFTEKKDTLRTNSLCMMVTNQFDWDVAIQVVENGTDWENFIHFRDILIANNEINQKYNDLKNACVTNNAKEYRQKKSMFIYEVLGKRH